MLNVFDFVLKRNCFEMDMRKFCWKVLNVLACLTQKFLWKWIYVISPICNYNENVLIHEIVLTFLIER